MSTQDTIYKTTNENNTVDLKEGDYLYQDDDSSLINEHLPQDLRVDYSNDNKVQVSNPKTNVFEKNNPDPNKLGEMNIHLSRYQINEQKTPSNRSFLTNNVNTKQSVKPNKQSPKSPKSENIYNGERRKSRLLENKILVQESNLSPGEKNSSNLTNKEEEFVNRLQARITTKGQEIIINTQSTEKEMKTVKDKNNKTSSIFYLMIDGKKPVNSYMIVKNLDNVVINKDAHFLERMYLDIFKRRTKEERLDSIMKKNRKKSNEKNIISTFNRLIADTNRRLETKQNIEKMSVFLQSQVKKPSKKYSEKEWDQFYKARFVEPEEKKKKLKEELYKIKQQQEKEKEEKIISERKVFKAPRNYVDKVIDRIYTGSIRRKNLLETCSHNHFNTIDLVSSCKSQSKSKNQFHTINNTQISTEFPLSLKSMKEIPKYNFTECDLQDKNDSVEKFTHRKGNHSSGANNRIYVKKAMTHNLKLNQSRDKIQKDKVKEKVSRQTLLKQQTHHKLQLSTDKSKISSYLEEFKMYIPSPSSNDPIITINELKVNDLKRNKRNPEKKNLKGMFVTDANAWRVIDKIFDY